MKYLQYCRKLGFEETPDYDWLRGLFSDVLHDLEETDDGVYDWVLIDNSKGWQSILEEKHRKRHSKKVFVPTPVTPEQNQAANSMPIDSSKQGLQNTHNELSKSRAVTTLFRKRWAKFKTLLTCRLH